MQRQAWTREDERKTRREKTAMWLEDVTASWALPRTVSRLLAEAKEVLLQSGQGSVAFLRPSLCRQMLFHWAIPLLTPSFWTSSLQNGETIHLWCFKLPSCWNYFIYFWLHWFLVAVRRGSRVVASGVCSPVAVGGLFTGVILLLCSLGYRCGGSVLVALMHEESSQTRDQTHVPCFGRRIHHHWITREVPGIGILSYPIVGALLWQPWESSTAYGKVMTSVWHDPILFQLFHPYFL